MNRLCESVIVAAFSLGKDGDGESESMRDSTGVGEGAGTVSILAVDAATAVAGSEPLWRLAVKLVAKHGLHHTARTLKLDYYIAEEACRRSRGPR